MIRLIRTLCFCLISTVGFAQQDLDTVTIRPVAVTANIHMLKGSGGNIGVLTGSEGILMIDDQFAPLSDKIMAALKQLDPGQVKFLVNTHIHGDHSGGNENFKKAGAIIVAHNNVREHMMKERIYKKENTVFPPRAKEAWPSVTFSDKIDFHLNDEDIELLHFSAGHTNGDVIVHFKKANVYHTGDAFVRYGYPYIDIESGGSVNGFITTLDKLLLTLDDRSKIIPGHGELATKADVKLLRDQLTDIRDQVVAALKKGKKPEEISGMGIADKYDATLGKGFLKGKDFVFMIAENLGLKK